MDNAHNYYLIEHFKQLLKTNDQTTAWPSNTSGACRTDSAGTWVILTEKLNLNKKLGDAMWNF